jgi:UDP-N-acetylmuramyl pentapeptide phosphotransferase/UDP-N-acetylglucosamine-1-phosphate transferase
VTVSTWAAIIAALALSLSIPFIARPLLERLGAIDVPTHRSSHVELTIRGAGVAPLVGILVGLSIAGLWASNQGESLRFLTILFASVMVGAVGLLEDLRGVSIFIRAGLQFLIGGIASALLIGAAGASWWWIAVGAFFFAAYTNAANFMDGINSISGLHGGAVGATFAVAGALDDRPWLVAAGLVMAASFLAFLPWNLGRRPVFLGDVGSYLLGGYSAIVAIAAAVDGLPIVVVLAPLSIYLADTGVTLAKRVARGERWHEAHRSHVFQRLIDLGWSHLAVGLLVTVASLAASAFGLLAMAGSAAALGAAISGILGVAVAYLSLPRLLAQGVSRFTRQR